MGVDRGRARCKRTVCRSLRGQPGQVGSSQLLFCLCALCSGLWYAWPLIQPPGWLMAGLVDLDQRLGGCLIMGRGASYCAGDVSRNEGPPLSGSLGTNRAYGDDTGEAGRYQGRAVAILGALGRGCEELLVCGWQGVWVWVSCCDVQVRGRELSALR